LRGDGHSAGERVDHLPGDRQLLCRPVETVHAHDVGAGIGELLRRLARDVALIGLRGQRLERHRHHHREPGCLGALDEQQRFSQEGERLPDPEVRWSGVELILELAVEESPDVIVTGALGRVVGPREREVARDQRIAFRRDLARDPDRVPVDLVDRALHPHGRELVVAGVEGHGLEHLGTGAEELTMELRESVRMLDDHFRREGTRLDVATLLELQQVAAVAQDRSFGETLQDPLRHAIEPPCGRRCPSLGPVAPRGERAVSTPGHA
jgi:hypothetical protein